MPTYLILLQLFILVHAPDCARADQVPLGQVVRTHSSGIDFEPQFASHPSVWRAWADEYLRFRRGRMSAKKRAQWLAGCLKEVDENPFCAQTLRKGTERLLAANDEEENEGASEVETAKTPSLADAITQQDLDAFRGVREGLVHKYLRIYPEWAGPLEALKEKALGSGSCPSTGLLTALGLKSEEYFPDRAMRDTAIALYRRANECGEARDLSKARFRLSLLLVWDGKCREADPVLFDLSEEGSNEFLPRALFWRGYCARRTGNKLLFQAMKNRMNKEFSLHYHTLVLNSHAGGLETRMSPDSASARVLMNPDPAILYRSSRRQDVNSMLRSVEMLKDHKAGDIQRDLLNDFTGRLDGLEKEVRLYMALLFHRAGDHLSQFQLISSLYRDDPSWISRSTLQLYFPLKNFDTYKRYAKNRVDPYLIAALIRQESGFNERARSPAGALGLMQLMPGTARQMERVSRRELYDVRTNVRLGIRFFGRMLDRYEGDTELALAAYNAGPERVDDWTERYNTLNRMLFLDLIPFKETRDYVVNIARNYYWYQRLYSDSPGERNVTRRGGASLGALFSAVR